MGEDIKSDMERFRALGHSAFVMGYSGVSGTALVKELSKAKLFKKVVLIGRREIPLDVGPEFEQRVVDFDKLDDHKDVFKDLDTGFCCLGVPSGGISEKDYTRITLDYVASSAETAKEQGCKHFTIVTGQGVNKNSWFLFARVKGELEEKLKQINFDRLSIFRPAKILYDSPNLPTSESIARTLFKPIVYLFPTALSIQDEKFARAMINNAVKLPNPTVEEVYENKTIHQLAGDS
uniref:NAD(P)-binding domain-containing protein n=1 Tax=Arion vulgaris TaxID=1028688 RepID=A0A0B7AP87_9EUPU